MTHRTVIILLVVFFSFQPSVKSAPVISGKFQLDTTIWNPMAYLSLIPGFNELYTMSPSMIIDQAPIDHFGNFRFDTQYLSVEDHLFRIHFSKREDPPASLIIGGKDENHFFLIANRNANVIIKNSFGSILTKGIVFEGYHPNLQLQEINEITSYLDSLGLEVTLVKSELIQKAIFENLRFYADTCSNPLVSLYALYKSRFENNYPVNQLFYKDFLSKWKKEESVYFEEFRKQLPIQKGSWFSLKRFFIGAAMFIAGFLASLLFKKSRSNSQNNMKDLTMQERKVFAMIVEGKSNKDISESLKISLSTVKSHVNSIYSKLEINSRKDALNLFQQEVQSN